MSKISKGTQAVLDRWPWLVPDGFYVDSDRTVVEDLGEYGSSTCDVCAEHIIAPKGGKLTCREVYLGRRVFRRITRKGANSDRTHTYLNWRLRRVCRHCWKQATGRALKRRKGDYQ